MNRHYVGRCGAVALAASIFALGARQCDAHGDVWLYADSDSTLSLGVADETGTDFTPGERIYEAILTPEALPFSPFDSSAEDPGFMAAAGDLPPSQPISLGFSGLWTWDGAALIPATGVSFGMTLSGGLATSGAGGLHAHPPFGLTDLTADGQPIPDGVYVVGFTASTAGLGGSEPGYLLLLHDALITDEDDAEELAELLEAHEEGGPEPVFGGKSFAFLEEVHEYVASQIPEPSGMMLVGSAACALAARRRRRA